MNKLARMIIVLTVIGLISGGILALVYQWSLPKIEANRIRETDAAIFKVLPATKSYQQVVSDELTYYKCFDKKKGLLGYAILCKGNGYQGEIKLMVGVKADLSKFILEQLETPGLGAKIAEAGFQAQFKGLAAQSPIEYVKANADKKNNEIQAITGATISSRAVVNIINKTVEQWLQVK
ncbi:RnfABCDGE type electron transport complex subunit G [Candidatus Margulisiibacteriota bacterium]